MSKLIADNRHAEWDVAMAALVCQLDLPDRLFSPIRDILGPGLGRVFFREWLLQDIVDPVMLANPYDVADGEAAPTQYRIDGVPEDGGTPLEIVARRWQSRAQVWFELYGLHIAHVVDWMVASRETNQSWLSNLDARGEPKKLLKCRTLGELVAEATKGLRHRNATTEVDLGPDDESIVADLGAGHTLVLLISLKALRHEGNRMHHCVGMGGYDGHIDDPDYHLLSVRNPDDKPLATLEIRGTTVRQFRGACNADPTPAVVDLVAPISDAYRWDGLEEAACGQYWPFGRWALRVLEDLPPVRPRPENRRRI